MLKDFFAGEIRAVRTDPARRFAICGGWTVAMAAPGHAAWNTR
jgi:hypothetical protein